MRNNFNNYIEYTIDYIHAGLFEEALQLLEVHTTENNGEKLIPLALYYLGWISKKLDNTDKAQSYYDAAAVASPDYCFPSKVEDIAVLNSAIDNNPKDYKAHYYLGNFWYANGQYDKAIKCWSMTVDVNDAFPTAHRNLSLAYYNKEKSAKKSIASLEKAFKLDTKDARILMELDQLYKINNYSHWQRLQLLEDYNDLVEQRDDLYLERIVLYNSLGDFDTAKALLSERKFHPWEGGEGKVVSQYILCHVELAKKSIINGCYAAALGYLEAVEFYPHNLGEGKLPGAQENDINFLQGIIYNELNNKAEGEEMFKKATIGSSEPVQAIFYNDQQPDKILYQGLSWQQLGDSEKAKKIFNALIDFSVKHRNDDIRIDYFAVSLPDLLVFDQDLNHRNKNHCHYLSGLGHLGLKDYDTATADFKKVLATDRNHQGAITHLNLIEFLQWYDNK
jgi:tetratricopeptide (TPR) repeat protein